MGDYIACGAGLAPMTTIATNFSNNGGISKQDRIRERELFRFYRPKDLADDSAQHTPLSSLPQGLALDTTPPIANGDVTLGALTQLVALRLGGHRSMINVIGREIQYTLVESTKTLDLINQATAECEGDESWVGAGGSMHKQQSICESVVMLPADGEPFLVVPDLRQDAQFKTRSYVQGPPYYRFYAGTPLRTAQGVVIGALCVFAHEPRAGLNQTEKTFLTTIADTIMGYLEMKRAAAERDKVTMMSRGLNAFVEGSNSQFAAKFSGKALRNSTLGSPLSPEEVKMFRMPGTKAASSVEANMAESSAASNSESPSLLTSKTEDKIPKLPGTFPDEASTPSPAVPASSEAPAELPHIALEQQIQSTLARATNLLNECLSLDNCGGVVFYDTVTRIDTPSDIGSSTTSPFDHLDFEWGAYSDGAITPGPFDGVIDSEDAKAPVLAGSATARPDMDLPDQSYRKLTSRMLGKFIRRYPSGKTWELDEHGIIPQDEHNARQTVTAELEARQRAEGSCLTGLFPGVRSLVFVPLWDANLSRHYSGCFVWTTDALSRFSADVEFSFVTAFSNSISAEISRLATIDADQRKSDFIGSISHELRSPLHGVLASAEFLRDTALDSMQSTLAMTIDSCGRTLLDTINHVLDYSKINSLRRTWKKTPKIDLADGKEVKPKPVKLSKEEMQASGIMSIMGSTDIAAITEEVVDSIYAGKTYAKGYSPADITDFSAGELARRDSEAQPNPNDDNNVQVLLDIEPGDYHFVTQPGAIRRIIMNIFGNALKYTDKGHIIVKLHQTGVESSAHHHHHHKVVLTVKDTGKGISSSYLKTRLYTPFAQENDLAPGTGLGLSIVRTIVTMLRGEISVLSRKGKGTEVRITFPHMSRPDADLPAGAVEPPRSTLNNFKFLKAFKPEIRVGFYSFHEDHDNMAYETEEILRKYLLDYCSAKCVTRWKNGQQPAAIIVDEQLLYKLEADDSVEYQSNVIVLCKNPKPVQSSRGLSSYYHYLLKPFGPYKLARAVRNCVDKTKTESKKGGGRPISLIAPILESEPIATLSDTKNANMATSDLQADSLARSPRPRLASISTDPRISTRTAFMKTSDAGLVPASDVGFQAARTAVSSPSEDGNAATSDDVKAAMEEARRVPRILVVDDNPTNRILLLTFLRKRGLDADEAQDGSLAVKAAVKNSYDIIFMDISMPVMNGFEATREIRQYEDSMKRQQRTGSTSQNDMRPTFSRTSSTQRRPVSPTSSSVRPQDAVPAVDLNASAITGAVLETVPELTTIQMPPESRPTTLATPPVSPDTSSEEEGEQRFRADETQIQTASAENKPAMIIALTGLASHRDQSEAFTSGVDLFMTKPVPFKEVGKLIDNWIANGGLLASLD